MTTSYLLDVKDLEVGYTPNVLVLAGLSFQLNQGEIIGVVGKNGSGKTTILRGLIGLAPYRRGSVKIEGTEVIEQDPSWIMQQARIGMLPQNERVFLDLSVYENLEIAAWHLPKQERKRRVEQYLGMPGFSFLRGRLSERAQLLSGGEMLLLALSCLSIRDPNLLLLDEPSSGSDLKNRDAILVSLRQWKDAGKGVLLIEQDLRTLFSVSDRILVIRSNSAQDPRYYGACTLVELDALRVQTVRTLYQDNPVLTPEEMERIDKILWPPTEK